MDIKIIKNDKNYKLEDVKKLLNETYWAKNLPDDVIVASIEHSECFYMYLNDELIGFCRAITDFSTCYYLCDVVVASKYRGCGYGKQMLSAVVNDKVIGHLKGMLLTKETHKFYEKFNFHTRENVYMQRDRKQK